MKKNADGTLDEGAGHYMRDFVYGANDGVITTFSIVSGVAGATLGNKVVLILGIANLVADGISMAASNYLGMKSDVERLGGNLEIEQPMRHAWVTFLAFVFAGTFPLLPYFLGFPEAQRFGWSIAFALLNLGAVGACRAFFTPRGFLESAVEMLAVGFVTGLLSFLIGKAGAALAANY